MGGNHHTFPPGGSRREADREEAVIVEREPLTTAVVLAVSDATGVSPDSMRERLYDHVDPDALNALFTDRHDGVRRSRGRLTFELGGCEVTVYADGQVVAQPE